MSTHQKQKYAYPNNIALRAKEILGIYLTEFVIWFHCLFVNLSKQAGVFKHHIVVILSDER